ncbi:hypothetical protein [Streptomyces mangrovisoli]|uniref:TetR family transcriptional regulator n=1 Tax=Streptomyces mangrovisoli TaxID=1428628 RepID=A0A1J4NRE3_9ACTN|nr:hypothetical protein [Streptomyces mangrovisoli]OIJ64951.1 hypothetical protein WN71_026035 [Streptomyces mangrovisoli]
MQEEDHVPVAEERRARGKWAGLDINQIIEAARGLDPDVLTMKAVADRLGVDRKALSYHISDRDTLLGMVAADTVAAGFADVEIATQATWQHACRAYAVALTDSASALGRLADHLRLSNSTYLQFLTPTEALLAKLVGAGFSDETALRLLVMLTNICLSHARDAAFAARADERPRPAQLRRALDDPAARGFDHLERIASAAIDTYGTTQLHLSIDVFLAGAEALLGPGG